MVHDIMQAVTLFVKPDNIIHMDCAAAVAATPIAIAGEEFPQYVVSAFK